MDRTAKIFQMFPTVDRLYVDGGGHVYFSERAGAVCYCRPQSADKKKGKNKKR